MKLRILDNSIRLRLTQSEIDELGEKGIVRSVTDLPAGQDHIAYSLKSHSKENTEVDFRNKELAICIPEKEALQWIKTNLVGLDYKIALKGGKSLRILIEKDFQCLKPRSGEDESDLFPNPGTLENLVEKENSPAEMFLSQWDEFLESPSNMVLDRVLHEDVVFHSPVAWKPQKGKFVTSVYLMSAAKVLSNDFQYVKKIIQDRHIALEFQCRIDELVIEGIDIITLDDAGKVIEFKVMLRPYRAIEKVKEKMTEQLVEQ